MNVQLKGMFRGSLIIFERQSSLNERILMAGHVRCGQSRLHDLREGGHSLCRRPFIKNSGFFDLC